MRNKNIEIKKKTSSKGEFSPYDCKMRNFTNAKSVLLLGLKGTEW